MQSLTIKGIVIHEPQIYDNLCKFIVRSKNGDYQVISEDIQAVKDNIFIIVGQEVVVYGVEIVNEESQKVLFSKKSKIILK